MRKKLFFFLFIFLYIFPFANANPVPVGPLPVPVTPALDFFYTRNPSWAITAFIIDFIIDSFLLQTPYPYSEAYTWYPVEAVSDKLKDAATKLTQHYKTDVVTFSKGDTMLAKYIVTTAEVGLEEDQLCLSLGDFSDEAELWEVGDKHEYIKYKGDAPKDVKISIVCDVGEYLSETVEVCSGEFGGLDPDWLSGCECLNSGDICCLVALRHPNA